MENEKITSGSGIINNDSSGVGNGYGFGIGDGVGVTIVNKK